MTWRRSRRCALKFVQLVSSRYTRVFRRNADVLGSVDGMNPEIGPVSYKKDQDSFQKPFSEKTAQLLDEQVSKMIREVHVRTTKLLTEKKEAVEKVAKLLLEKEKISRQDMINLLGERPFVEKDTETIKQLGWSQPRGTPAPGVGEPKGRDAPLPGGLDSGSATNTAV